jgi:hypothetical protein
MKTWIPMKMTWSASQCGFSTCQVGHNRRQESLAKNPKAVDPDVGRQTRDHDAVVHWRKVAPSSPYRRLGRYPYFSPLQYLNANHPLRTAPVEQSSSQERQALMRP